MKTPFDLLEEIYQKYGYCQDSLIDYSFVGSKGQILVISNAKVQKNVFW